MVNPDKRVLHALLDNKLTLSQRAVFAVMSESTRLDPAFETTIFKLAELLEQHVNSSAAHLRALDEAGLIDREITVGGTPDVWTVTQRSR